MEMGLKEAIWALEGGYCVWVGAGLTRQVAGGFTAVPLWGQITEELESAAGIQNGYESDFPKRLDKCLTVLGESEFNSFLRERYYTQLCEALLVQADILLDEDEFVPDYLRAVAALGQLANPIVSFNIEPLSSLLLVRPAGPFRLMYQQLNGKPAYRWREPGGRFQRLAYHPHGLATVETVMTHTQYKANKQTLAFEQAIHASFGNTLVIVGMSLDDDYLREQVEQFRASLGGIYWFNDQFSDRLSLWAEKNNVTTVYSEWSDFWEYWSRVKVEVEPRDLAAAWYLAVCEAVEEVEGGSFGALERLLNKPHAKGVSTDFKALSNNLVDAGSAVGESGKARLINGKEPKEIELKLRDRMIGAGIPLPRINQIYSPLP